ncbi:HNH endonuclease signature motif containing protein [Actinobaculum massiliense]|uniref:HNH nuclease domain-containing protein n=1 Tax=Actinobaculum massiliense ACS-171-V-Col2 TaxID=883066 RepID=K9EX81_9ACTO|nr:HNH endonuclease signature motif containing protein [Actinobaculum massiliense]EKU95582.1 hypothetical protein HMPREF9233_00369 [Actinobaculum massiliense ACS-171-V-Col2]MDK8319040.1 HNH endonuclease signature motif containing protein [Actinobaculum massiliense]MDK8567675.1 HNH endonuclease signature motif containing protein [Actinobaculum massiliense]
MAWVATACAPAPDSLPTAAKPPAATETLSIWDDPPAEAFAGYEPALLGDGTPLLPSQLGHLLCDSIIIRTVFTGPSTVLDTGRETRLYSESQKHAVIARDRGCTFPGCTDTYHTCDIHHAQEWSEGGKTDLNNAVCLCWRHHRYVHTERGRIHVHEKGLLFENDARALLERTSG